MEKEFDFKNIGKRMPYRTPDGFFGKMQKQVLERTQAERFNRQNEELAGWVELSENDIFIN